ncbi:unnamed protein product [Penicillium olsonii]|nr:unnamed protein product [Penicillium olsonii]
MDTIRRKESRISTLQVLELEIFVLFFPFWFLTLSKHRISSTAKTSSHTLRSDNLAEALSTMAMSTQSVHADDLISSHRAIAPAMHVAVNYRYARDPDDLVPGENINPNAPQESFVYSRYSAPNSHLFEIILKSIFHGEIMTYSTGLAAFHAIMVLLNPKRIFIGDGYHGVHGNIDLMTKLTGVQKLSLDDLDQIGPGDIIHIETPLNPTGEARNLSYYGEMAHAVGAFLTVDATFGPPPLQDPLQFRADIVLHSGTKYIGGHSDMMCGILVVHPERAREGWMTTLYSERLVMGNVMGNLEGWLGIRSLRTLELRVRRQSETATSLVSWIYDEMRDPSSVVGRVVRSIRHASLQQKDLEEGWLKRQMAGGFGPVFAIWLKTTEQAKSLPSKLQLF